MRYRVKTQHNSLSFETREECLACIAGMRAVLSENAFAALDASVVCAEPSEGVEELSGRWESAVQASGCAVLVHPWTKQLERAFERGAAKHGARIVEEVLERVSWSRSNPTSYALLLLREGVSERKQSTHTTKTGPPSLRGSSSLLKQFKQEQGT